MENSIRKTTILLGLLFIISYNLFAQNTKKQEPLISIINNIENQYNIQFNYVEDVINGIALTSPNKDLTLTEVLEFLERKTELRFTFLNSSIILINQKEEKLLCGYIRDKENLEPIAFAAIQTSNFSTISNEKGFFEIKIKDLSQPLTISHLGYVTQSLSYKQFSLNNCSDIYLQANFQSLSEIVISNYITTGINKMNNGSYEIDFSKFDILPGLIDNDVLQSVQAFPGIQSVNETVSNINIRGGTHDQNLILWDGIKMYQSGHFFGLISMYNPQITQKVLLRKNGSDVSYTDGVSGTISMQTEHKINKELKTTLGLNLTDVNAFIDLPVGKSSSLQVSARKSISNFIETPTYTAFFDRISQNTEVNNNTSTVKNTDKTFDFYDTSLRWIYKISDKDEIRLNFINVHNELQFTENAIVNNIEESKNSQLTQNSIAGGFHYNRVWNDKLETTFNVYETDYKLKAVNVSILDSQRFLQENKVSETCLRLKTNYNVNNYLQWLSGYHFTETEVTNLDDVDTPLFKLSVSEVIRTHSGFTQLGYKSLNRNTSLNLGVRYNYIDKLSKSIWEPRLSFSQQFLNYFEVEILGEFKHQYTSQVINFQNDFLGIEKRRWQLSNNKDIPVITSKQISLGINYNNKSWLFSVEGYLKEINGITSQSQGFQNQYEFVKNKGSYDVSGLDVLLRKKLSKFNTWLSYSYMDNVYLFEDLEVNAFPSNYNVSHALTLGLNYSENNLNMSAGLNWHSGKSTTKPVENNEILDNVINFGATNKANLKDYLRLDVSAQYNFKLSSKTRANVGVSIWNLLNKENELNNFYRVYGNAVNETIQQSLKITPNVVFRVYF